MDILLAVFVLLPIIFLALAFSGVFSKRVINKSDLMKYTNDFLELYDENEREFQNELIEFKKIERIKNISAIVIGLGLVLMGLYEMSIDSMWSIMLFLVSIMVLFAILILNGKYQKRYKEIFKACVIKPYVEKSIPALSYEPNGGIPIEDYREAHFDDKVITNLEEDDHIWGNICKDVYMDMSEVKAVNEKEHRNKKGKLTGVSKKTQFWGMCCVLSSTRFDFKNIYIRRDKFKILPQHDRVKIDSPDFEKYFDLYSEHRNEAKKLMEFQLIDTLTKFVVESGLTFEIALKGSKIYMRFYTGEMFEPAILSKIKEKDMLWIYHSICEFIQTFQEVASSTKTNEEAQKQLVREEDRIPTAREEHDQVMSELDNDELDNIINQIED